MKRRVLALLLVCAASGCADDQAALLDADQLTIACVVMAACDVEARPSVSLCAENYLATLTRRGEGRLYGEMYRCAIAAAANCEKVRACFGAGPTCTRQEFRASCEGSKAITCDLIDDRVYSRPCGHVGLGCEIDPAQSFASRCVCDTSYGARCEGGYALRCDGGQVIGTRCADQGQRCREGRCVGNEGDKCDRFFHRRCEGSVAVLCHGGTVQRVDCSEMPLTGGCRDGSCVPAGTACADDFNRCTADGALEACIDGRWRRFDCSELGLGPCSAAQYGANCGQYPN